MHELREKYIQGKLSEAERKTFEESLSVQERLELATELGIQSGLEHGFRNELRTTVAGFEKRGSAVRRINPAYISIAASLFLVASLVLFFTREQTSVFDQYYEVYPNYEVTSLRGEVDSISRMTAYAAYDAGNFELAIEEFGKIDALSSPEFFFRGVCYIQTKNYELALTDFDEVLSGDDKNYRAAAIWYSALIHLKQKNKEKAIPLLKKLSEGESEFATVSVEVLERL